MRRAVCGACGRGWAQELVRREEANKPRELRDPGQRGESDHDSHHEGGSFREALTGKSVLEARLVAPRDAEPGSLVEGAYQAAKRETGVEVSTLAHYLSTRKWKAKNLNLKAHAKSLGRCLDLYHLNHQPLKAFDVIAAASGH